MKWWRKITKTPNNERFNPLANLTDDELRRLWGQADETPGEIAGGFAKGEIYMEIIRKTGQGSGQIQPESLVGLINLKPAPRRLRRHPSAADEIAAARYPRRSRWVSYAIKSRQ